MCSHLRSSFTLSHPLESCCGSEGYYILCGLVVTSSFLLDILTIVLQVIQADSPMLVSLARVDYFEFSDRGGYASEF